MIQVYLIAFVHSGGAGNFFHHRDDGKRPSMENIRSMERKIAEKNVVHSVCITAVSRLDDCENMPDDQPERKGGE